MTAQTDLARQALATATASAKTAGVSTPGPFVSKPAVTGKTSWLYHPVLDFLVVGGLSLVLYAVLEALRYTQSSKTVFQIVLWGSFLVNYPHYAATYFRVYRTKEDIRQYYGSTIITPLVLLALVVSCFWFPAAITPWLVKAYLTLSGYHYSGQTYGVAMIYANKHGFRLNRFEKLCIMAPIFVSYLIPIFRAELVINKPGLAHGVLIPVLGWPMWTMTLGKGLFVLSMLMYFGMLGYACLKKKPMLPAVVTAVIVSQIMWFVLGVHNLAFAEFVAFFHCLQYLAITTFFYYKELQEKKRGGTDSIPQTTALGFLKSKKFIAYYAILIVGGILLFRGVPYALSAAGLCTWVFAMALTDSFLNLHHFILDGDIWKLRKPNVGKPLLE